MVGVVYADDRETNLADVRGEENSDPYLDVEAWDSEET